MNCVASLTAGFDRCLCDVLDIMSDWLFPAIVIGRGGEFIADSGLRQPLRRMMIKRLT
jgi:hypothetical protein